MNAELTAGKLKQIQVWLKERPWLRNVVTTLVWIIAIFGVQKNGYSALGIALILTAFFVTLMLGSIAVADYVSRGSADSTQKQRSRNVGIALALGVMVLLFYAATIVRMGANVVNRPLAVLGSSIIGSVLR